MRRCRCCKRTKPVADFLPIQGRGWKVTICDACARENMRRWGRDMVNYNHAAALAKAQHRKVED